MMVLSESLPHHNCWLSVLHSIGNDMKKWIMYTDTVPVTYLESTVKTVLLIEAAPVYWVGIPGGDKKVDLNRTM
jgi:hypothetical protein